MEGRDDRARALIEAVAARQAELVARWLLVGFVHGVMNTDNMSVAGETIDYGPCAFLDAYDARTVFSSIDRNGRYAYGQQPRIALWNLTRFAETLLPLLDADEDAAVKQAEAALATFGPRFDAAYRGGLARKLGFSHSGRRRCRTRRRSPAHDGGESGGPHAHLPPPLRRGRIPEGDGPVRDGFVDPTAYDAWAARWRTRLADDPQSRTSGRRRCGRSIRPSSRAITGSRK